MRIAMAQMSMAEDYKTNLMKTFQIIEQCKEDDLVFFPEIQMSPFFPGYMADKTPYDVKSYAMKKNHYDIEKICELAKQHQLYISPNIYLQNKGDYYDASLWITPDGEVEGISKMVHVMQAENFYEKDYYTPSPEGFKVYKTSYR